MRRTMRYEGHEWIPPRTGIKMFAQVHPRLHRYAVGPATPRVRATKDTLWRHNDALHRSMHGVHGGNPWPAMRILIELRRPITAASWVAKIIFGVMFNRRWNTALLMKPANYASCGFASISKLIRLYSPEMFFIIIRISERSILNTLFVVRVKWML